jgi:hypothetical protein
MPIVIHDQSECAMLAQQADAPVDGGVTHRPVEHCPRHAPAEGAVPPRGGSGVIGIGQKCLVTREVKVVVVGGVGGLEGAQAGLEGHPESLQPQQVGGALPAEPLQCRLGDCVPGFLPQVVEHILRRIRDACLLLDEGAAPGVDDAPADSAGAAPVEALHNAHTGSVISGLDGRRGTGGTKANHRDVHGVIPVVCIDVALKHLRCIDRRPSRS